MRRRLKRWFYSVRLERASALAFALSADGLHEAIYEAISAANDRIAAIQSVTQALR